LLLSPRSERVRVCACACIKYLFCTRIRETILNTKRHAIPVLDLRPVVVPLVPDVDFWVISAPAVFAGESHPRVREAVVIVEISLDTKKHVTAALSREREGVQGHRAFIDAVDDPFDLDRMPGPAQIGGVPDPKGGWAAGAACLDEGGEEDG
jgi:hypothetical protein